MVHTWAVSIVFPRTDEPEVYVGLVGAWVGEVSFPSWYIN